MAFPTCSLRAADFQNKHGVFFNGGSGQANTFVPNTIDVAGVLGANAGTIVLSNSNVSPLDLDGDGIIDLLHMPIVKTYAVYTPFLSTTGWTWLGRENPERHGAESDD